MSRCFGCATVYCFGIQAEMLNSFFAKRSTGVFVLCIIAV